MIGYERKKNDYDLLYKKIVSYDLLSDDKAESLIYALQEIKNSIDLIYEEILPKLVKEKTNKEKYLNLLWDVREEFRHIDYHIKDSEILDL